MDFKLDYCTYEQNPSRCFVMNVGTETKENMTRTSLVEMLERL